VREKTREDKDCWTASIIERANEQGVDGKCVVIELGFGAHEKQLNFKPEVQTRRETRKPPLAPS
jgi:hypothetical protein